MRVGPGQIYISLVKGRKLIGGVNIPTKRGYWSLDADVLHAIKDSIPCRP